MIGCPNRKLLPKIEYFIDQNGPNVGDRMKINFDYFQMRKWMLQTATAEKVDEKIGVICLGSLFLSWVMVLEFSKKAYF